MALIKEEKERLKLEKRIKKYNKVHKLIENVDHKLCKECENWIPCNNDYFYRNKSNAIDGYHPYCKKCTNEKSKKWQTQNYDKYQKWFTERNKNRGDDYYEKVNKKWNKENEERIKETLRKWQLENKDKLKEYREFRIMNKKHDISKEEWESCKDYFDNSCAYCGMTESEHRKIHKQDLHKEHVVHDGANDLSNCVPACKSCNSSKKQFSLMEWYNKENANFCENKLCKINDWLNSHHIIYLQQVEIIK